MFVISTEEPFFMTTASTAASMMFMVAPTETMSR